MDGRTQVPVIEWMKREYGVDYVDAVTEPGPVRVLAEEPEGDAAGSVRERVAISVEKHGSKAVAVVAHFDCAGNPASKDEQLVQLRRALETVRGWGFDAEVVGLWVDENWTVKRTQH
jgi:hypothetical protein